MFNGLFSGTTRVSQYHKGKTNLDFTEARDSEWQWHQLGHMQVCISLQTDNHASTSPLSFPTGWMPFLPPNQQHQSTEGYTTIDDATKWKYKSTEEKFKRASCVAVNITYHSVAQCAYTVARATSYGEWENWEYQCDTWEIKCYTTSN